MISKERMEKRLASLPAKSGHAKVLRRKIAKLYPDTVVESVIEPVVEKKPRKKRTKKTTEQ